MYLVTLEYRPKNNIWRRQQADIIDQIYMSTELTAQSLTFMANLVPYTLYNYSFDQKILVIKIWHAFTTELSHMRKNKIACF